MDEYQIHDLSDKDLERGLWLEAHKEQIKKYLLGFAIFTCVVIWSLVGWGLYKYLNTLNQDQAIMAGLAANNIDWQSFRIATTPVPLEYSQPLAIYSGAGRYDIIASAYNPNVRRGVAKLTFVFVDNNFISATATVQLLPQQKVYLLALGNQPPTALAAPILKVIDLQWGPLSGNANFASSPVEISQVDFKPTAKSSLTVNFDAFNVSPNNFWSAAFQAVLMSNGQVVGANQVSLDKLLAGGHRQVSLNWYQALPKITQVDIVPVIDVFSQDNYFTPSADLQGSQTQ